VALYWLVFFFNIFYEELKPYKPLLKFIAVKAVLFLTFWQEQLLAYFQVDLAHSRYIPPSDRANANGVLSCLLVDIEMVLLSIVTAIAYNYKDFELNERTQVTLASVLKANAHEILKDMSHIFGVKKIDSFTEKPEDHILIKSEPHGDHFDPEKISPEQNIELEQIHTSSELKPNTRIAIKNNHNSNPSLEKNPQTSIPGQLTEEKMSSNRNDREAVRDVVVGVQVEQYQRPEDYSRTEMRERESLGIIDEEKGNLRPNPTSMHVKKSRKAVYNA